MMSLKEYNGSFVVPVTVTLLAAIAVVVLIAWLLFGGIAKGADIDCMTREQARAKYPGQWLYWHTANRCWDNRKGGSASAPVRYSANKNPMRMAPAGNPVSPVLRPTVFYPSLMSGGGTDDMMLRGETMQTWPVIADFDADPPLFLPWQRMSGLLNR